jgi:hypothetical protein
MSYRRVIPRDLFNEASLLKCYGRLFINLETAGLKDVELNHDGEAFDVRQDASSGGLFVANVVLKVAGKPCRLHRPLNSRDQWPLYLTDDDDEELSVFNEDGSFAEEFVQHMKAASEAANKRAARPRRP